jgi:hypothetical protein
VDWDGDGIFDGSNEGDRTLAFYSKRGRDNLLSISSGGVAQGFEKMRTGLCTITLDNYDERYNPYNTSSPLYGYIEPGKLIRIKVKNGSAGSEYPVFYGKIVDIQPGGGTDRIVVIRAEDGISLLANADISISLQQSIGLDDALDLVLTAAGWPAQWSRAIDSITDAPPYWWADGKALLQISKIADSELGTFFHAADGTAKYYSRHQAADPTYTITSSDILKEITIPQPWEVQRNKIKITIHPRSSQTLGALWSATNINSLAAGDSLTIFATYAYGGESPVPAANVVTPVATTDYTMNSDPSGAGTDLTSYLSIMFTDFGTTAKMVLTNIHPSQTGYITLLQVRGEAIAAPNEVRIIQESGNADRALVMDLLWVQTDNTASEFANYLLSWLQNAQIFPTVIMESRPDLQFAFDLQDTVALTVNSLEIDADYKIGMIEHSWIASNGQAVRTKFTMEPLPNFSPSSFWVFPTELGISSIFAF